MTLLEVMEALWRRKWIIIGAVAVAAVIGVLYLGRLTPDYKSTATTRISPVMSQGVSTGVLAGVPVDVDPSIISSSRILAPSATALGVAESSLEGSITADVGQSQLSSTVTLTVVVTAHAPTPIQAQRQAKAVVSVYSATLDDVVATTLKTLQARKADAEKQATAYSTQLARSPGDAVIQANLGDAVSTISALNSAISSLQLAGPSATVISSASPGASTNPSTLVVVGFALLCGLLAGIGIALVRDRFDDRLHDPAGLSKISGVPTLIALPNDRRVKRHVVRLPAADIRRTALSEAIRSLRTSIQVLLPSGKGVVAITSVEPGDGKTFVSSNLAVSWARAGRTVILVGGDLRRPELDLYFPGAMRGEGLAGLLTAATDGERIDHERVEAALQPTAHHGLRTLPPGHSVDEPADLLAERALAGIVRTLADQADIVVIDTPPALALADASVLGAQADGVVLLALIGRSRRALIAEAGAALASNGAVLLGTVANREKRARLPRSYGSYYLTSESAAARESSDEGADSVRNTVAGNAGEQRSGTPEAATAVDSPLSRTAVNDN
ncbi:hypothetical protein GCM10022240_00180 [Microbacterium kribbense]|uniref:Polysaccharide chain length determinant N-terminal domain-containing protein n=1 Tax=Microbacterium kribbense TaxID=433645 RepID=A0ABP7FZ55_9MICO